MNMLADMLPGFEDDRPRLNELAPAGWVLAFNYTAKGVEFLESSMPPIWQETYVRSGVFLDDPVFRWIVKAQSGATRWSDITISDPNGILRAAQAHGMRFGMAATRVVNGLHSFVSLSRGDREFSDDEISEVAERFFYWVDFLHNRASLTDAELSVLAALRDGLSQRQAATRLSVSVETIKYRSQRAQEKLRAKSSTQAVAVAQSRNFI